MDNTKCIAALFDFDGVVMDTETQYSIFWDEIGRQYFPQIFTQNIFQVWKKNSRRLLLV